MKDYDAEDRAVVAMESYAAGKRDGRASLDNEIRAFVERYKALGLQLYYYYHSRKWLMEWKCVCRDGVASDQRQATGDTIAECLADAIELERNNDAREPEHA